MFLSAWKSRYTVCGIPKGQAADQTASATLRFATNEGVPTRNKEVG